MNKRIYLAVLMIVFLVVSGCSSMFANSGKIRNLTGDRAKEITIDYLIENWKDYDIYYAGLDVKLPLGIIFDPKGNNTTLTGDAWKKVDDQKTLKEVVRWIYPNTQIFPWMAALFSPDNQFLGYLYYCGGPASLKKMDDSTYYMFNLEHPDDRIRRRIW